MTTLSLSHLVVVQNAIESTKTGGKFQTSVRQFIAEEMAESGCKFTAADSVADICTDYRDQITSWILEGDEDNESTDSVDKRKKVVLNRINDVSRITKELVGYAIKCTNRKEGIYSAEMVEDKSEESELPAEPTEDAVDEPLAAPNEDLESTLIALMDQYGDLEVGGMVAMLIDRRVPDAEIKF